MSRRLHWGVPESPPPKHPYRDSAILYAVFAVIIVLVAWATGGAVGTAAIVGAVFFVVATAWSMFRWRSRIQEEAANRGRVDGE
jgi:O-antigen ligase